jgi:hypothetical protein
MFALKLALVALSVLFASLASRRFGHAAGGMLAGLPMIAGPIMGFVLLQATPARAGAIALATLACLPATVLHMLTFGHAARRWRWPGAWLLANAAFLLAAALLTRWQAPAGLVCVLALLVPLVGLAAMPSALHAAGPMADDGTVTRASEQADVPAVPAGVPVSAPELGCRVVAALALAWAIMRGASQLPAALSGLLLALPVTGNVLPVFTLPQHGRAATISLLAGFVRGLLGFASFFIALYAALPHMRAGGAYAAAWLVALLAALLVTTVRQRWQQGQSGNLPEPLEPLA